MTTLITSRRTRYVAGIDLSADVIARAKERNPHLHFVQADGLDIEATRALLPRPPPQDAAAAATASPAPAPASYSRILIDISGKAPLHLVCAMILGQRQAYPDAYLIVKNEALFDALVQRDAAAAAAGMSQLALGAQAEAEAPRMAAGNAVHGDACAEDTSGDPLYSLLGDQLAECEAFRHSSRKTRTRPYRFVPKPAA